MDTLPTELIQYIFNLLDTSVLLDMICVNYSCYAIGIEILFSNITFYADPYKGNLTRKSTKLLTQLYSRHDIKGAQFQRIRLVRQVTLLPSRRPFFKVTPHAARTLNMVFFQLLQHEYIQSNLHTFQWRMSCTDELTEHPFMLPRHLKALECVAGQIDTTVLFPALKRLSLHQTQDGDGEWVSRQIQHSNLQHLWIGGTSSRERIVLSRCSGLQKERLKGLKSLGLEHVHIDIWPLPRTACLKHLTLRCCSHASDLYRTCTPNLSRLEALTFVTEEGVLEFEVNDFRRMLWSCKRLRTLAVLLAGRASSIPLSWIQPIQSSLETLILDARLSAMTPVFSYGYSIDDINQMTAKMPNLAVLGLPIDLKQKAGNNVCST
ncbi:hypothetical protein GQ44DRAFT_777971 [Phaeosphaeriaceae sp. PMI808]|nr:hypothetical protein GQ44DRAFT_777971 [Phaeosphaeriaceae sp. PMI808]